MKQRTFRHVLRRLPLFSWPIIFTLCAGAQTVIPSVSDGARDPLGAYDVTWESPSRDSQGSMPLGNGDIGLNLWTQKDGTLRFYISKTDAWDEQDRLLKLGEVVMSFSPNPFSDPAHFEQVLHLRQGLIQIDAGQGTRRLVIRCWVDANHPLVHIQGRGKSPFVVKVRLVDWRKTKRPLTSAEASGTDRFAKDAVPVSYPDAVVTNGSDRIVWYHRNAKSIWQATLRHQGIGRLIAQESDPLLHRTFGAVMAGPGLRKTGATTLETSHPGNSIELSIDALTARTGSAAQWLERLNRERERLAEIPLKKAFAEHLNWWNAFWNRSWIRVTASRDGGCGGLTNDDFIVSRGYALQRFINACGGRGAFPIKFNGSIFTVDVPGKFNADYRRWGGCYWFQNTRLPYWSMLASGDYDCQQPLFAMYRRDLALAKGRTEIYFHHPGAFFPETMHSWGAYHNGGLGYGWDRQGQPIWRTLNGYIRYYRSGGLELTAMMLDRYAFTRDTRFFHQTLLPLASAILGFYDHHYPRNAQGKLVIAPAQALETWWNCTNPLPV